MTITGFVINRVSRFGFRVPGFEFRVYLPLVDDRWFGFRVSDERFNSSTVQRFNVSTVFRFGFGRQLIIINLKI